MTYRNAKTILFASLIAAMILPFSGMNFAQAEQLTEDPMIYMLADRIEGIEKRIDRTQEKIEKETDPAKLDNLEKLLAVLEAKRQNLIDAGEELGYMAQYRIGNPELEAEFYAEHPPEFLEEELTVQIECGCQIVKGRMGYKYPVSGWSSDYYMAPTSYQNLYYQTVNDVWSTSGNQVHATLDWILPFAYVDTSQDATITAEATWDYKAGTQSDEETDTQYIYNWWAHRIDNDSNFTNVVQNESIKGTLEWQANP